MPTEYSPRINIIATCIGLPRELRQRLDNYNTAHNLPDNLTDEIVRRLELSFVLEESGALAALNSRFFTQPEIERRILRRMMADQESRETKYIVVGRLPYGHRTYLDTPEEAIAHAKSKLSDKPGNPLLVAEIVSVVERTEPLPPPVQVRPPRKSDFAR